MNPHLANRITMVLAFLGIFVAGVLSYSHLTQTVVPCSTQSGCETVTSSVFSQLGGIPIAYLGLAGYIFLAALAGFRFTTTGDKWRTTSIIGLLFSIVGAAYSVFLQIISLNALGAKCDWCMASAGIMVLMVVAHGIVGSKSPEAALPNPKVLPLAGALFVLAMGGIAIVGSSMAKSETTVYTEVEDTTVFPSKEKMLGPDNAGVTIVQIADFNCPACRVHATEFVGLVQKYPGLRIAHRNFPLYNLAGHETSIKLAMASEYAANQGKFWDFYRAAFAETNTNRIKSFEGIFGIARELDFDMEEFEAQMNEQEDDRLIHLINEDFTFATEILKIDTTPTFTLVERGKSPRSITWNEIEPYLKSPSAKKLLDSGR